MKEGDHITFFSDYNDTEVVYHVACITDIDNILRNGIKYNDKSTYDTMYFDFHKYISSLKPDNIPDWVKREKAIFASLNYNSDHSWHSHTVIMSFKIDKDRCWVANENLANRIYEPFILKNIKSFEIANKYLDKEGKKVIEDYWNTSLSFNENLVARRDKEKGYDAEVMIFHDIEPDDITILRIISDHKIMTVKECLELYKGE
ncbi:hypothetical protein [Proteiniborus sp. MB09-C3]|uniref:hypothetical protein n=1 Tax=Proteiniborus sp. MB09-C3 TaxID=3050072 RepID=UPI0025566F17|nr:hypothetical protein [Proteiniborus sp. MB09-C3]WIV11889.1 hypothetical protein QO263_17610 [Proteiniborus sp. MB09-C3]